MKKRMHQVLVIRLRGRRYSPEMEKTKRPIRVDVERHVPLASVTVDAAWALDAVRDELMYLGYRWRVVSVVQIEEVTTVRKVASLYSRRRRR